MKKKLWTLILVLALSISCIAVFSSCDDATAEKTKITVASNTELTGDFRWPGFGSTYAAASDKDINTLTVGYSTMERNAGGSYVWNATAVKSHTETEDNGNLVVTVEINEGLKFSDGTDIKAENYLASVLALSTPIAKAAGHTGKSGERLLGFSAYSAYTGAGISVPFEGVRLLSEYKFSLTLDGDVSYFAPTRAIVSPIPLLLVLGDGVEVKDDGNGAYLSAAWYDMADGSYMRAPQLAEARYNISAPTSGAYRIVEYNKETAECILEINPEFKGNYEGRMPSIDNVVFKYIPMGRQLDALKNGEVDIATNITGANEINNALAAIGASDGKLAEAHYTRAGYGMIHFVCDFGPTMFASVRQAIAYSIDAESYAESYTGGYGTVVYAPFSPDFDMWQSLGSDAELCEYLYSPENAKEALIDGGWIYNSKGGAFVEGGEGADSVRYKKLTVEEASDINIAYKSVSREGEAEFKTVKVGDDYYMPLAVNWFTNMGGALVESLPGAVSGNKTFASIGLAVCEQSGELGSMYAELYRDTSLGYSGTPTFGMFNMSSGWNDAVYDYSYNWSLDPEYSAYSMNRLYDEYDRAFPYDITAPKLTYSEAKAASGDKLGMDYLSMAMVYNSRSVEEYNEWWLAYIERWNELMPDIPLYSNDYYNIYNTRIENYMITPFRIYTDAILYATVKE